MVVPPGHALLLKKEWEQQAARFWWLHLKQVLDNIGYVPSQYDNFLYILCHPSAHRVIWLHDDGVVTASSTELLKKLEADFRPRPLAIVGYAAWWYRGGPWEPMSRLMCA